MLVYIIDGFNLIHKIESLKKSDTPHRDLIHYIRGNKLTGSRNNKVIIVFDGKPNFEAERIALEFEIIFSQGLSADEIIKRRVKRIKNKSGVIVVSDDREIRSAIKGEGAKSCRIDDFIKPRKKAQTREKEISYTLQKEITEEMRKVWLKE